MTNISEREQMRQLDRKIMAERSALTQWIEGKSAYPVGLTRVEIPFPEITNPVLKTVRDDIKWRFTFLPGRPVDTMVGFVPQQDDLYEWVDVDVAAPETRITELSYLIEREERYGSNLSPWEGNPRQRLKDFLAGKIDGTKLVPFTTLIIRTQTTGVEASVVNLMHRGRDIMQLLLTEVPTDFSLNQCVVKPYVNNDEETMIDCLDESGQVFSRFIYQPGSDWFSPEGFYRGMIETRERKKVEVEEVARAYVEGGGKLSEYYLRKIGMKQLADDIRWYFPGGMKALREQFGLTQEKKESKKSKAQDANAYLRDLVFGGEEI